MKVSLSVLGSTSIDSAKSLNPALTEIVLQTNIGRTRFVSGKNTDILRRKKYGKSLYIFRGLLMKIELECCLMADQ